MSLANLTININANTGATVAGLQDVGSTAKAAFAQSNAAIDDYRSHLQKAADHMSAAAKQMGGSMDAANDAIVAGAARSEEAIAQLQKTAAAPELTTFGERMAQRYQAGMNATKAKLEEFGQWMEQKAELIGGLWAAKTFAGPVIGAMAQFAATAYATYKAAGWVFGLFSGESYKSASIDQLIALNDQVKALQTNLHISAQEAGALLDATARLGVDKADYTAAYKAAEVAMRSNGDELDRLGIRYKTANGQLVDQQTFLQNAKAALDAYTVGWDRNQAAAAIGAGSYEQITAALQVTRAELEQSKARMDEYGVAIGPATQAAVARYQQAMRDFNNETKLMGQGVSRAIADQIMPALTDLAVLFKDGFPTAVRAFRYSMAGVTSLLYGIKEVFDIVWDVAKGAVLGIGELFAGLGKAAWQALHGNLTDAADTMRDAWTAAGTHASKTMEDIVADSVKNRDRMAMAWGFDDRTESLTDAGKTAKGKTGATWQPKPAAAAADTTASSAYQNYLLELDRTLKKVQDNEYAAMRLKAAQLAQKEGITDLAQAYNTINAIQRQESQRAVDDMTRKLGDETAAYSFQSSILGLTALQQDKLTYAMQKRLDLDNLLAAARKSGKPLDDQAITDLRTTTESTIALGNAQRDQRDATLRSQATGVNNALLAYRDNASNAAKAAENAVTGSLHRMEDALVQFGKTGKLSFKDLFGFMADEYLRQQVRMAIGDSAGSGGLLGSALAKLGSLFGGGIGVTAGDAGASNYAALAAAVPLATGTNYVPYDGMPAVLHKGEAVVPAAYNPAAGGRASGGSVSIGSGQVIQIGQGVSRAEVTAGINQANAASEARLMRRLAQKGVL